MTVTTSSSEPSRDRSKASGEVNVVLPPTLFRLPDLASVQDTPVHQNASAAAEAPALPVANPELEEIVPAPIFEIRYDDAHRSPPSSHLARKAVPIGPTEDATAHANAAATAPRSVTLKPESASGPVSNPMSSGRPVATTESFADSEPEPRSRFEKYGSRILVATALLLIASATWLMGRPEDAGTGPMDLAGDNVFPSDAQPEPLLGNGSGIAQQDTNASDSGLASNTVRRPGSNDTVMTNADVVSTTLGKPAQNQTGGEQLAIAPEMLENANSTSPAIEPESPNPSASSMITAKKPGNEFDAMATAPATEMLGDGPMPGGASQVITAPEVTTATPDNAQAASADSPLIESSLASPASETAARAAKAPIPTTSTPAAVTDWLKYLPQPSTDNMIPTAPSPQQASTTTTPNDPYAAYQNYISGGVSADGPSGTTASKDAVEPQARTAVNPYSNAYGQPSLVR